MQSGPDGKRPGGLPEAVGVDLPDGSRMMPHTAGRRGCGFYRPAGRSMGCIDLNEKGSEMIYIVLGIIGAVAGSFYLYGRGDFLLGGAIGLLAAAAINQRNRLLALEKRLKAMEMQGAEPASQASDADAAQRHPETEAPGAFAPQEAPSTASFVKPPRMRSRNH